MVADPRTRPKTRWRRAWWDLRRGLHFGYPRCCVLWFVLGGLLGASNNARRRGTCHLPDPDDADGETVWVPCRWHAGHRRGTNWRSYNDHRRMLIWRRRTARTRLTSDAHAHESARVARGREAPC